MGKNVQILDFWVTWWSTEPYTVFSSYTFYLNIVYINENINDYYHSHRMN